MSEKLDYESYFGELNYILKSVAELTHVKTFMTNSFTEKRIAN